jgi:hypothetical protein
LLAELRKMQPAGAPPAPPPAPRPAAPAPTPGGGNHDKGRAPATGRGLIGPSEKKHLSR